jgi:hypothetical protein
VIVLLFLPTIPGLFWVFHVPTGVGDVDQAESKIKIGMTRDEVRSLLGDPHAQRVCGGDLGEEWDYWESIFVGSVLRVHFGLDERVLATESWCH